MSIALAFDVYGTLFDLSSVERRIGEAVGKNAREIAELWRSKQLEYSFRRALMRQYRDFSVCSYQALEYALDRYGCRLPEEGRRKIAAAQSSLSLFPDVVPALEDLTGSGCSIHAFSNGARKSVKSLLEGAGIERFFDGVVSAEAVSSFKPDPAVYAHFLEETGSPIENAWLVSGNPFDLIGALSFGMKAIWIRRSEDQLFDPWGIAPTLTVESLTEIPDALSGFL